MKQSVKKMMLGMLTGLVACQGGIALGATDMESYTLDNVVVTANRFAQEVSKVPASVSVITEEDIKTRRINSVVEALEFLPGIYASQKAEGGIMLRGFTSNEILVMKDGQILNGAWNGTVDWNQIPVESIKRIELVKGAGSSLYGGRAVAAVINIITRDKQHEISNESSVTGKVVYSHGTYNTQRKGVQINVDNGEHWYGSFGFDHKKSDGFVGYYVTQYASEKKDTDVTIIGKAPQLSYGPYLLGGRGAKAWENKSYNFSLGYRVDENSRFTYDYQKIDYDYRYVNPFSYVRDEHGNIIFKGKVEVTPGNIINLAENKYLGYYGKRQMEVHNLAFSHDEAQLDIKMGLTNYYGNGYTSPYGKATIAKGGEGGLSWYPGKTYNFEVTKAWDFDNHKIVAGINVNQESFVQNKYDLKDYTVFDRNSKPYETHQGKGLTKAIFVQDRIQFDDHFAAYLGVRYDLYRKYDGRSFIAGETEAQNLTIKHGEGSFTQTSPKVVLEYTVDDQSSLYVSYGKSFNPPILYNVYRQSGMLGGSGKPILANPDLRPERSTTYEVGYKVKPNDKTRVEINAYHVDTIDKVVYMKHPTFKRYENASTASKKGFEFSLMYDITDHLSAYTNFSWQKAVYNGAYDESVPTRIWHSGLRYNVDQLTTSLDMEYISSRQSDEYEFGEYGALDPFFVANLSIAYKLMPSWELQLHVNNLFDRHFFDDEGTAGRTYTFTTRYTF